MAEDYMPKVISGKGFDTPRETPIPKRIAELQEEGFTGVALARRLWAELSRLNGMVVSEVVAGEQLHTSGPGAQTAAEIRYNG